MMADVKNEMAKTPLGLIQRGGVTQAMSLLYKLELKLIDMQTPQNTSRRKRRADGTMVAANISIKAGLLRLNEDYFMLIPTKIPDATLSRYLLFSQEAIDTQRIFCKSLLTSLDTRWKT